MEVWNMVFLFNRVIFRFHIHFPGCTNAIWDKPKYPPKGMLVLVDRWTVGEQKQDRGRYEEAIAIFEAKHKEDAALDDPYHGCEKVNLGIPA